MKKAKKVLISVFVAAAVYCAYSYEKHVFTAEKWISQPDKRVNIVDDMLDKYELEGMESKDIQALLGSGTDTLYFKEAGNIVYCLGPERGLISIDSEWLVICFENGIVSKHYIARD